MVQTPQTPGPLQIGAATGQAVAVPHCPFVPHVCVTFEPVTHCIAAGAQTPEQLPETQPWPVQVDDADW
jgi:hypothetical protein